MMSDYLSKSDGQRIYLMNLRAIGARVRQLRKHAGIPQEELAEALRISRSTIAGIETGRERGGIEILLSIADHFNVPMDWLLARGQSLGSPPRGQLVERPDEIAILNFWHSLTIKEKHAVAKMLRVPISGKTFAPTIDSAQVQEPRSQRRN